MNFLQGIVEDSPSETIEFFIQKVRVGPSDDLEFLQSVITGAQYLQAIVKD